MADRDELLRSDFDHVLAHTQSLWDGLRGGHVFITGGTGFFGRWMLGSLLHANAELGLGARATILTRSPASFAKRYPELGEDASVELLEGDLRDFKFPAGPCTHVLHMGIETNTSLSNPSPSVYFETGVDGTRRVLKYARARGATRFLLTSSGAVYGAQPPDCPRLSEESRLAPRPEDLGSAYGHAKRAAEFLCCAAHSEYGLGATIARCFAFVGPYLPLDSGFAIGNFIGDALAGREISVTGDGTPRRSYLYAADLAIWLWTIALAGRPARPYNVGSERDMSIADIAGVVARVVGGASRVMIAREPAEGVPAARYVPDTSRAARELGLDQKISLEEAVRRTSEWYAAAAETGQEGAR